MTDDRDRSIMNDPYEMRFRDFLDILRRRRRFVFRVWAVTVALGVLLSLAMRPAYRASSEITADQISPVILLDRPGITGQNLGTTIGLASPDVPTLMALARSGTVHDQARARLAQKRGERAARALLKTLRVQRFRNSDLVSITADSTDPVAAADAANAVTQSLIEMDLTARRQWAREMRESIEQQLAIVDPRLRMAEDALADSKTEYGDVPLSEKTGMSLNRLAALEAQRVDIRMRRQETKARMDAARTRLAVQTQIAPTQWKPSPLITTLQTQLATEEIELSGLRQQFTPKHPAVLNASAKIGETRQKLDAELVHALHIDQYGVDPVYQQLVQQLRQDEVSSAALDAGDRALTASIDQHERNLRQLPARETAQVRLARSVKEAEAIHQALTDKLQQALVTEASIGSVIRAVDVAQPPAAPIRSRFLGLLMGAILGLVAGIGGALVKEQVEDPLKSADHAERGLGTPILGAIPRLHAEVEQGGGDAPELRTPAIWESLFVASPASIGSRAAAGRWRSAFAESFRYLRTNLLCLRRPSLRTLMVTSPGGGEGKDIVAANLAVALAQAGLRVWLVDCDLRRPALQQAPAFQGVEPRAGLADVLGTGAPERAFPWRTPVENLWFLPAGVPPANPAELLGSPKMQAFLQQEREDVDIIVLAAPPVLPVSDAAVLAPSVEGVLLVVHIGITPQEAAQKAGQRLRAVGGRVLGTVLNGVPMEGLGSYFNYYARYYGAEPSGPWYFGPGPKTRSLGTGSARSPVSVLRGILRRRR